MGAPDDEGEVEELDASMLEPEDALVLPAPKPIAKADATMAITAEDGWFDVPVPVPVSVPPPSMEPPPRLPSLAPPPAIPRTLTPRPPPARATSPRASSHDTTTRLVDDDVAIVSSIALPRTPTPRAVSHDTTTRLVDDDVAIVASIALPRTPTPPLVTAPTLTPDERLQREASALAAEYPMRAALLHAYRAFAMLDDAAGAAAAQHAPDARFVAFTRRWLAAARGDRAAIAAAVRAELPLAGDATERAALLWQIAHGDEATLRQIVELDGQDVGAWLALAALAMRRQAYPAAAEAFEAIGARTADGMARAVFLASAAGLREARCADDAGARAIYDRAFEADPGSVGLSSALEMFALRTGARSSADHVRMVALEAQRVGALDPQLGYHERAGDLYWEALRDSVNAAPCYERAAALAPTDVVALGKLASLHEQDGQYGPLATVYEALLERLTEPVRLGAVLLRLGGLYESRLDRTMDALRCYQAALAAVPTLAPAAQALARLHQSRQRWGEAAIVLMGEVDRLHDPAIRAARYLAIAEMLETHLGTIPQVVKLFERALALDPGQTAALDALDRVYRASGRWPDLIALYETQLEGREGHDGHAAHPMRVRALRIALATLYRERAAAPEQAAAQLRLALVGAPDPLFVMVALARALADAGRWAEHVAVLEQQAQLVGEGPELVATLYRIAAVIEVRLDDPVRAQDVYQRVLALAPRHELAAQALRRLHVGQARWEDALASERRLLVLAERPEEAAVILHRIAHVAEEHLARPDDAIAAYEQALAQLPTYRPARVALERLLRGAGKFERLATLLAEQAAGGIELTDRARLLASAALILELHVPNKRAEASARYAEALVADPSLPAALWGQLRGHVRAGDWKRAADVLETLVARATSGKVRARLTIQRVHVLERLGDVERAAALAEHAFLADADPAIILARLRIAMARGDADTLLWLDEAARVVTDPRLASGLLRVRAHAIEAGGDREAAAEAFAIALQHGNLPAVVDGLARHRAGPALGEALAIRAALIKDPPTRALLYAVAGTVLEQPDARAHAYSAALAAQPGLFPALEGHRLLALRAKDWRGAATICAEMAAVAVDARNRVELFEEAAAICVEHLRDDVAAIAHYREVLAVEPGRPLALARALALLEGAGDWGAATQLIAGQLAAVEPAARARLLARRAHLLAEHLGDGAGAIADLERALALQPDADELRWRLAGLHESLAQWADAAQAYEALATSATVAPDARCRALVAQARIWTAEVPDYPRAQRYLEDAVLAAGARDRGIAARLAEVAVLAGDLSRATALYQELATYGEPVARVEALLAAAALRPAPDAADPIA
ncbi:MAG: hypothetical protein NT062_21090, partial [Proteobacteria bacterium]|nr:hypothetical protein [Pseudomonadota bacterium]